MAMIVFAHFRSTSLLIPVSGPVERLEDQRERDVPSSRNRVSDVPPGPIGRASPQRGFTWWRRLSPSSLLSSPLIRVGVSDGDMTRARANETSLLAYRLFEQTNSRGRAASKPQARIQGGAPGPRGSKDQRNELRSL